MKPNYPILLTIKSNDRINKTASHLAKEANRNRSQYVRDVINTLADREDLREAVNEAIGEKQP